MRQLLALLAVTLSFNSTLFSADPLKFQGLPVVSDAEAWQKIPPKFPPLPVWARTLVTPLPKTTAAMLELDRLHRAENPLGPVLSAKVRWIAADTIGCEYARRYAEADLKRAKVSDAEIDAFIEGTDNPTDSEKAAYKFARKLTNAAYTVSDSEFALLLKAFGPDKTCGLVHTLAYCNFQNRILLALGVEVEANGPLPPFDIPLDPEQRGKVESPPRPNWSELKDAKQPRVPVRFAWTDDDDDTLDVAVAMESQKKRSGRMPVPDKSRFAGMPADVRKQTDTIVWMTISMGYQPKLTQAWFTTLRAYQSEAKFDRLASNSVFWIVTRSNECFY
jgi:alkylhydroperoxidase family enzyme